MSTTRVSPRQMRFCDACGLLVHTENDTWVCRACEHEMPRDSDADVAMATTDGQRDDGAPAVAIRSGRMSSVAPFTAVAYPDRTPLDQITAVAVTTQVNGERTVVLRYEPTEDGDETATVVLTFNRWMRTEDEEARAAVDAHGLAITVQ